jgi:hypothetical protein
MILHEVFLSIASDSPERAEFPASALSNDWKFRARWPPTIGNCNEEFTVIYLRARFFRALVDLRERVRTMRAAQLEKVFRAPEKLRRG